MATQNNNTAEENKQLTLANFEDQEKPVPFNEEDFRSELGEDIDFTVNEDGTIDIEINLEDDEDEELDYLPYREDEHSKNLVEDVDPNVLEELSQKVLNSYEDDDASRSDWLKTIEFGFDLLGVQVDDSSGLFDGACTAQHPLLMESAVKFQSKASNELLPADGPVNVKILGDLTEEKEDQARRVKNHMNYQITEEMTEFYPDMEKLLLYTAIVGSGFKKTYYDSHLERPVSEFIPADQFVVSNAESDLYRAERYTHVLYKTKYQLEADFAAGLYKKPEDDVGIGDPSEPLLSDVQRKTHEIVGTDIFETAEVYTLLEQHVECYIEGIDPYPGKEDYELASPYIITVEYNSGRVIGIRRNWKQGDEKRRKRVPFTHYGFVPGFGFYHFGFLQLLGNIQLSLTSALRSLVDAGQFANLQGGFKLKGVRVVDDGSPIEPGQFKEIESHLQDINKAIMPLPFKGADQTLYQMLEFLDIKGQKFADSTEQVIADSTNYGPVGTTMALLDASTKFFSAIHKRMHKSLKHELRTIAEINGESIMRNSLYNESNPEMAVYRSDYNQRVDITPVSDPNISSSAHRMTKAQTMFQIAQQSPELHDMREVLRHVYVNMDYANVDKILPPEEKAIPNDPITDIQNAIEGKPIKAFEGQDHNAHIAVKQAFLQDPQSGGSGAMPRAAAAIQANIQEHMVKKFKEQVKAQAELTSVSPEIAAAEIARMNQQQLIQQQEQAQQNNASNMLAQAEFLDSQTEARKQEFEEKYKKAELELQKEKLDLEAQKLKSKMLELDQKHAHELDKLVTTKSLDSMIKGLEGD